MASGLQYLALYGMRMRLSSESGVRNGVDHLEKEMDEYEKVYIDVCSIEFVSSIIIFCIY